MSDELRIEVEHPERPLEPGDALAGVVRLRTARGQEVERLVLRQLWRTHGRGNADRSTLAEHTLHEGPLPSGGEHTFEFQVEAPPGPFTYHGRILSVDHHLEASLEASWADDPTAQVDIGLVPGADTPAPSASSRARASEAVRPGRSGCGGLFGLLLIGVGLFSMPVGLVFVGVGLLILVPSLRTGLAAGRLGSIVPGVHPAVVAPGEEIEIRVEIQPERDVRINRVAATVRALEVCVGGRGSDATTHREELHAEDVVLEGPATVPGGRATVFNGSVRIPDLHAYTFTAPSNRVVWQADLHVDIPSWPDWSESTVFVVWPVSPRKGRPRREIRPPPPGEAKGNAHEPAHPSVADRAPPPAQAPGRVAAPTDSDIARRIRAILDEPRFGGDRPARIRELEGREVAFGLVVAENERSFGVPLAYRNGRTLTGTVEGTELPVAVRFPPERNRETEPLASGDRIEVRGRAVEWETLAGRTVVEA
jgi:hypothetical protein